MSPTLHLSCAISSDGYLDDASPDRAILSSPEDLDAVLAFRAQMDMIVVGAETLRRDNPSLATRGDRHFEMRKAAGRAEHPVKVVVTRGGEIPTDRAFFETGTDEKIILTQSPVDNALDTLATVIQFDGDPIDAVLSLAKDRHHSDILIEGGAQMLQLALPRAQKLRLAISPKRLGQTGYARLTEDVGAFLERHHVTQTETLGDTTVHYIDLTWSRMNELMVEAFRLSELCPTTDSAFAVGAIACTEDFRVLSTGYSRETGPKDHAEEAMLSKLVVSPDTVVCTLEPCFHRVSKSMGCSERLLKAGMKRLIYAITEDETFTQQSGLTYLEANGVELIHLPSFEDRFRRANPAIYQTA
ncbi:MAG: dihydrofolate reductase family protein [Pseudomonadota bacterium]